MERKLINFLIVVIGFSFFIFEAYGLIFRAFLTIVGAYGIYGLSASFKLNESKLSMIWFPLYIGVQLLVDLYHFGSKEALNDIFRLLNYLAGFYGLVFLFRDPKNVAYFLKKLPIASYLFMISVLVYMIIPYYEVYLVSSFESIKSIKFYTANDYGYFANPISAVGAVLILFNWHLPLVSRYINILRLLVLCGIILLMASFTSIVGLIVAVSSQYSIFRKLTASDAKIKALWFIFGSLLLFLAFVFYAYIVDFEKFNDMLTGRPALWLRGIFGVGDDWVLGKGPGSSLENLSQFITSTFTNENLSDVNVNVDSFDELKSGGLHNIFLTSFYEKGIVVTLILVVLCCLVTVLSLRVSASSIQCPLPTLRSFYKYNYLILTFFFIRSLFEIGGIYGNYNGVIDLLFIVYISILVNAKKSKSYPFIVRG